MRSIRIASAALFAAAVLSVTAPAALADDAGIGDGGQTDSSRSDSGLSGGGRSDTGQADSGRSDRGLSDISPSDITPSDISPTDSGRSDTGQADSGRNDSSPSGIGPSSSGRNDWGSGDGGRDEGSGHNITSFGFTVSPTTVSPGGTVTLNATGCEAPTVRVTAPVFDDVTLTAGRSATATVFPDAKPGARYTVTFECKGERGTTTLTISGGGATPAPVRQGVQAGVGGSLSRLDATQLIAGTALVAGALGAGVYAARRRSGTRG
ncbi:hypothetical protein EOT10_22485 [Streptomyces antnestii]|uniref:Lipoprotein n=1 Tax=Streptomyces antnestii TaxID=2494256 RepID=A0A3S2W0I1_9ACTN|nr:hypothetical protein [Streptomyces sp. San01]RVU22224.1 hypothetical protein EOT10_22485 [Streptomyces sp. San01]